ncbi:CDF family Co(II)/Ni(II) efflux transporter DmeF [Aquabacterium sp. A08]|uniref:CDF family Co(II)/Ni(II) efflux transporter DmeF n=1 Tax=Aquabacterium sp. A08 TaxID=2718532 RepID=UPI00141D94B7|nr:CDF family Co(II)/Ni(II) efflux transporter DmeF [Aquabacterium sp. A08]NIC42880.1 CDF family Co(II)/Ni(II) efflux transporter DmeF [Aquabacterium sp. A08]
MNSDARPWQHTHDFHRPDEAAERGTRAVLWITLVAMGLEIGAGGWLGSMALLADGWHMGSHAAAIGVSALAYAASRRLRHDPRFAFGTWKIEVLGGFASALFLLGVAALMAVASVQRLLEPQAIQFQEAIGVAVVGLLVNLVCAVILGRVQHPGHGHAGHHSHGHGHDHHDLNLRSAYVHVLADALTSVLAIVALVGGWVWGWVWLDPAMGLVGAGLIAVWARGLLAETGRVLLDREMDHPVVQDIREVIDTLDSAAPVQLVDLHVWRVARGAYACTLTLVSPDPDLTPHKARQALALHEELVHCVIEIHRPPPDQPA